MRCVAFLLSILVLGMTIVPCTDGLSKDKAHLSAFERSEHAHDSSQNENDGCSPFCVCQCCHTPITIPVLSKVVIDIDEPTMFSHTFHYSFNYAYSFIKSSLRPPIAFS